jgi:catechol 2,3-dioxygenase-like lactoylglutathione lyase family enzyme
MAKKVKLAKKSKKSTQKLTKKAAKPAAKKSAAKKSAAKKAKPAAKVSKPVAKKKAPAKKATSPKPSGSALMSVAPGFTANDAAASIKWYCDVLGFTVIEKWEHEGQFLGAQIGSGCISMNIGQDDWKMGRDRVKGQGSRMYIMTGPDIDAYATAIKSRGGVLASEPTDGWGMRAFSIDDPDGFKLTFMTAKK